MSIVNTASKQVIVCVLMLVLFTGVHLMVMLTDLNTIRLNGIFEHELEQKQTLLRSSDRGETNGIASPVNSDPSMSEGGSRGGDTEVLSSDTSNGGFNFKLEESASLSDKDKVDVPLMDTNTRAPVAKSKEDASLGDKEKVVVPPMDANIRDLEARFKKDVGLMDGEKTVGGPVVKSKEIFRHGGEQEISLRHSYMEGVIVIPKQTASYGTEQHVPQNSANDRGLPVLQPEGQATLRSKVLIPQTVTPKMSGVSALKPTKSGSEYGKCPIPISQTGLKNVDRFVLFIGYPRSGHSIVAALMDAHPNVIIAHEFNLFGEWTSLKGQHSHLDPRMRLFNALCGNSYTSVVSGWRSSNKTKKGYTLDVKGSWQGRYHRVVKVIGDKAAGKTIAEYSRSRSDFLEIYRQLLQMVEVPVLFVHVVRNPYDMVSTRVLYSASPTSMKLTNVSADARYSNPGLLEYEVRRVMRNAEIVQNIVSEVENTSRIFEIHLSELVRYPRSTMIMICEYFKVECSPSYLQACERKVFKEVPKTRLLVEWTDKLIEKVGTEMKRFPFFSRYSFDSD